jgi:hypothetical protein
MQELFLISNCNNSTFHKLTIVDSSKPTTSLPLDTQTPGEETQSAFSKFLRDLRTLRIFIAFWNIIVIALMVM